MDNYTISEVFTLPSKGKIYPEPINPEIELRSMTTRDEMKRTSPDSEHIYKPLCEMIEGCIVGEKPKIHVYDMCFGDFIFLLHKLRIVTYGKEYKLKVVCPNCGATVDGITDLNNEAVLEWNDSILEEFYIELPKSKKRIHLNYTTPRMLDNIQIRRRERMKKMKSDELDPGISITAQALIDTVDGEKLNVSKLETFVDTLNAYDYKYLMSKSKHLEERVGLDTKIVVKCGRCGYDVVTTFRLESEFFDPVLDR